MAITTYAQLQTAVINWLKVSSSDFDTDQLGDLITLAEKRIFRNVRVRAMETTISSAISAGVVAVPSDYVEAKHIFVQTSGEYRPLGRRPVEWIYQNYPVRSSDGTPKYFARESGNLIFGPYPDSGYTISGVYYKRLTAIATTANDLFTNNPDLYLMACLVESEPLFGRDARLPVWEAKYRQIVEDLNNEDRREQSSGSVLSIGLG